MPGALFSPEPTPDPDWQDVRLVRFAPRPSPLKQRSHSRSRSVHNNPDAGTSRHRELPTPSRRMVDEDHAYPDLPSDHSPVSDRRGESSRQPPTPFRPRASVKEVVQRFRAVDAPDTSIMLPRSPGKSQPIELSHGNSTENKNKGKEKQRETVSDADCEDEVDEQPILGNKAQDTGKRLVDLSVREMSNESRVRGKERELLAARHEQRERANRRETDDREKERDKERIRALEEEVHRLQAEVNLLSCPSP